jgi:hypothetical protein
VIVVSLTFAAVLGMLASDIMKGATMTGHRITTLPWIIESAGDTSALWPAESIGPGYNDEIIAAVNRAIDSLDPDEADFVCMYYLRGMTYVQIARLVGCLPRRLESKHRIVRKKLEMSLRRMLGGRFNIPARIPLDCPLCDHPRRCEIDDLIRAKTERDTWKRTIRILKIDFAIPDVSPQMLITHGKYHML